MTSMKKRRRLWWLLGTVTALAALSGAMVLLFPPPPSISLTMKGYATVGFAAGPYPGNSPWRLVSMPCALTLVTNVDNVPVHVSLSVPTNALAEIRQTFDLTTRDSAEVFFGTERVVAPNSSIKIAIPLAQNEQGWQAEFEYYAKPPRGKLAIWLSEKLPNAAEKWLSRIESEPNERTIRIGPFTNSAPESAQP